MNIITILLLFLYIIIVIGSENLHNLRLRNTLLRVYVTNDYRKEIIKEFTNKIVNKIKTKTKKCYEKTLTKYYDLLLFYNNLTDEEKEAIDFIISLCY